MLTAMGKKRKKLTPAKARSIHGRFALHLRALMDARGWQVGDLHERLALQGLDIEKPTLHKWLRGDGLPRPESLEAIGKAFGLRDYRDCLPPPL